MSVRPAETQISPGFRPFWSESSVSARRYLGSLATHWAHSDDSDQTGRMPRLIWVFDGRTLILFVLLCRGSNNVYPCKPQFYYNKSGVRSGLNYTRLLNWCDVWVLHWHGSESEAFWRSDLLFCNRNCVSFDHYFVGMYLVRLGIISLLKP